MRTIRIASTLLATLLIAGASGTTSRGDEIASAMVQQTSAVVREDRETHETGHESSEVAELQARLAALEARLQEGMPNGYEPQGGPMPGGYAYGGPMGQPACGGHPGGCGCEECCCTPCCCKHGGVFVDAEFVYLKPHSSDSGTGFNNTGLAAAGAAGLLPGVAVGQVSSVLDFPLDPDFEPTVRFAAGAQLADGFGVRGRYWEFDHRVQGPITIAAGTLFFNPQVTPIPGTATGIVSNDWNTYVLDLEVFDSTDFGGWSITWSAGFRYVEYTEDRGILGTAGPGPVSIQYTKDFHGFGLTSSIEFRRQVLGNIGAFANLRASVIMGDETNLLDFNIDGIGPVSVADLQRNDVKFIYEAQAGAEWTKPMCGGGYLYGRAGAEIQFWDNFGISTTSVLLDESTGFGGFFAAVGIAR